MFILSFTSNEQVTRAQGSNIVSVVGAVMFILSFTANEQVIVVSQSVLTDPYHGAQTHYVARSDYYLSVEELYNDP